MIKIAICDDEDYFKETILNLLKDYFLDKGIDYEAKVFDSGIQLIELEESIRNYDLIFLDINMPELNGIETAKQIRNYTQDTFLVFISSYLEYSLEGYKVNAIRYLLKNSDNFEREFAECLDAIISKIDYAKIKQLFEFKEGKREVQLDNIMYVESNLHKLTFSIMEDEVVKYTMYEKLDIIEEKMRIKSFCRIHKSYLVNLKYIVDMRRYKVILVDRQELNTSKARYKDVFMQFLEMQGVT